MALSLCRSRILRYQCLNQSMNESDHNMAENDEPLRTVTVGNSRVTILGTAHVSRASADKVRELLCSEQFDAVAVELCPSRYNAIVEPDVLAKMNLFQVLREGKASMVTATLALGAYQQRMAEQFGIEPGAEMRAAIECARDAELPVLLVDREVGVTLKRIYRNVPWWRRFTLIGGLIASVVTSEEVSEEDIERLKEGDILESTFSQFAAEAKDLYMPLIDERDRYMAARLRQEASRSEHGTILAVVGAGHLRGIERYLAEDTSPPAETISGLELVPPAARWPKYIPWIIVALILAGFAIGFSRSTDLGWQLVVDWVVINGGLAALGATIALAHPLTIVSAFLAAPLTSLNPTVGAGMATAAVEVFMRKPTVGDFSKLRQDTTRPAGWWQNRVSRSLLVFFFSTLGSAIGTYVAGFRIFGRLTGG